jgi:hypothetical protein
VLSSSLIAISVIMPSFAQWSLSFFAFSLLLHPALSAYATWTTTMTTTGATGVTTITATFVDGYIQPSTTPPERSGGQFGGLENDGSSFPPSVVRVMVRNDPYDLSTDWMLTLI